MLNDLLIKARSCRSFKSGKRVDDYLILSMLDDARITSATRNAQPLKYRIVSDPAEVEAFTPLTYWAKSLGIKLPPEGHEPTAYVIMCHDEEVVPFQSIYYKDVGICGEVIMLSAAEEGLGCCMIGSFDEKKTREMFGLSEKLIPVLVLALGYADEEAVIEEAVDGKVKYYRDENNVHHVPKRRLEDIILK